MTLEARATMTPEERARWRQQMQLGPPLDPNRFAEKQAWKERRIRLTPDYRAAYDDLHRVADRMALTLRGFLDAGRINRKEITDLLHDFEQCARATQPSGGESR